MGRLDTLRITVAAVFAALAPGTILAMPVQFNVSSTFNADVIVNANPAFDPVNISVDFPIPPGSNWSFGTQSAMNLSAVATPAGLPDNGFFPANVSHPDVQLAYRNTDDGLNARRSTGPDTYSFLVPADNYSDVHLFMTTGNGTATVTATATYTSGLPGSFIFTVPDWFSGPAPHYALIDGLDRIRPTAPFVPQDSNAAAIFGFSFDTDETRILQSVTIVRAGGGGILNFFGATGVNLASVPEPATLVLLGIALAGLGFSRRRRHWRRGLWP